MTSITIASTRETFGQTLLELGRENPDITVVGGDLNKSTFANLFGREFQDRFFDMGAAEQNIMSVAAGLAFSGKIPFANTFAVFGTGRPYDQIRVGIAQPKANVKIVCTHSGITVGEDGISAQSIEDIALMCALPGFTVIVPADAPEAAQAVREAARIEGPFYIRLSRSATPVVHGKGFRFKVGKADVMRSGSDVTIAACGVMVASALEAAEGLKAEGLECRVLNMATLQPLDEDAIKRAALETGGIVTAEEHYKNGGLGSLVSLVVAQNNPVPVEVVAQDRYAESGKPGQLLEKYGLAPADIRNAARRVIQRKKG
ncbi:MAG: transketolase [SAR202 cluster bacterium Io17-Chloro-G3]|nr:MAG: transketolase [SAR202 cluster bacterium Io17-Chloro-G3]